ncbi:Cyclin-D1-binding protein 1-like protein [Frankliniella fusca]|uniref:Cyclin-D1-binding protein 1-like protein n=1 Tax=Frankliniella fusca TaxID=407009 RepID=A0AAE1HP62_9NEOP|nr:Cyclin-D1-binding protein 1-like protein [Frankliniella fusca]
MALTVAKVLETAHCSVKETLKELTEAPLEEEDESVPTADNFWQDVGGATQQIASEVAKLTLALTQPPKPAASIAQSIVHGVEAAWTSLVAASRRSPPKGSLLRKELRTAVLRTGEALATLLKALKAAESGPQLQMTGCVWEACSALEKLPRDNLAAVRALLAREEMLLTDAFQEIEEEVKCYRLSENSDNSANWTNQDRELLNPCVGLVRTARASIKKVSEAVRLRGNCKEPDGAQQLDRLAIAAEKLSPAVDTFVAAVYPPMNKSVVSSTALSVVTVVREFLELARQSDVTADNDNEWLSFLLRAVDHNNNKVQPLLSPD